MSNGNSVTGFNFDFATLVQASRVVPEHPQGQASVGVELPPTVKSNGQHTPYIQREQPEDSPGITIHMMHHSKVFTLWKPWETCPRCQNMLETNNIQLSPFEGDWDCPHTSVKEYKEIMDMGLKGKYVIAVKELYTLQSGARCAHVEWLEPDEKEMKRVEQLEQEKIKNRVWPPDVEGAFSKDKKITPPQE